MKKLSVLVVLLFALSLQSFGQAGKGPAVILGNIMPKIGPDGKQVTTATREEIIANPILHTPPPPCDITGFMFSYYPKGKNFNGPYEVKGAQLTPEIIKMLKAIEDPEGCMIYIENIAVKCGDQELRTNPIIIKMTAGTK